MSFGVDPRHLEKLGNCNTVGITLLHDDVQQGPSSTNLHLVNLLRTEDHHCKDVTHNSRDAKF